MIKAVIFDLGNVLGTFDWSVTYKKITEELGISKIKTKKTIGPIFNKLRKKAFYGKTIRKIFEEKGGIKLSKKIVENLWLKNYKELSKDIRSNWDILKELKKRGLRIAILSNMLEVSLLANKKMGRVKRLKKIGVDTFIWSCEAGVRKPNPKIYKILFKKLELLPSECFFIDDKKKNISAAKKLGMDGIVFKSPEQLRKKLVNLKLLQK